uniref:Uncharacterized protein n=1 Tax=Ralstonia solanacearum TaxID=305 RepID=A0A0S4WTI6_RALSL|nr:protein of unknown function [Ralstonia solanacearum]CUV27270.1 protein of unknown function [Ralstonia solanacearum]CUV54667.1 protein of unknown function [Ralstonia solanacearum]
MSAAPRRCVHSSLEEDGLRQGLSVGLVRSTGAAHGTPQRRRWRLRRRHAAGALIHVKWAGPRIG